MAWVISVCCFSMSVKVASFKLQFFLIMQKLSKLKDCWVFPNDTTLVTGNYRCSIDLDNVVANIPSSCFSQILSYRSVDELILMNTRLKKTKLLPLESSIFVSFFHVYGGGALFSANWVLQKNSKTLLHATNAH